MKNLLKKENKTMCHSGLDPESKGWMLNQVQHDKVRDCHAIARNDNESGRSMVEMLGVLAVVGVLSVAGVAGFKAAMKRHHANEILYEANKRATMVASQKAQGRSENNLSVAEFNDNRYGVTDSGLTGQFAITVDDVDTPVCQKVMNNIGESTQVRYMALKGTPQTKITVCSEGSTDYALVYNNDLSTNSITSGGSTGEACDANNPCLDNCQECNNGYCKDKCNNGEICAEGSDINTYICIVQPSTCANCASNQYCDITSSSDSCTNPDTGNCLDTETSSDFETRKVTITWKDSYNNIIRTLDVYKGDGGVTWWTAKNWCKAHNKQMVSLADLGIDKSKLGSSFSTKLWCGGYHSDKCNEEGVDWSALISALGYDKFWTKESIDARYKYRVSTTDRFINGNACYGADITALCK